VAFLAAAYTLFLQILIHRIVSAKLLNNFAFLVISLTMLGFAFSGVVLTRGLRVFEKRFEDALSASAALAVLTAIATSVAFYHADVGAQVPTLTGRLPVQLLRWVPLSLVFAVPFAFCGLILGALLSLPDLPARRVYFFDLAGSAVGAFAVIPSIGRAGVEASLIGASLVLLVGVALLAPPRHPAVRALAIVAGLSLLGTAVWRDRAFSMRYPSGSMLSESEENGTLEHVVWDPIARIEVSRTQPPDPDRMIYPSLIGRNRAFLARFRKLITQNNYAFTYAVDYDGRPESLHGIEETIYAAAYQAAAQRRPRVLVIGVGGGFDILTALAFDASEVTGVEINSATVGILEGTYRDYFRRWVEDPRVRLVRGEGRHYLATQPDRYDVIQLSGVDSYSGTVAAAHVFSENYLYTAEAFDLYLSRLTDHGILNMMRLEHMPPREMLRALTTAVAALRRAGVSSPAEHVAMISARNGIFAALLVKRTPFTAEERDRLARWVSSGDLMHLSAAPGGVSFPSVYQAFLGQGDARREADFAAAYPFDIKPVADDRPFFFRSTYWWHLWRRDPILFASIPFMEYSLVVLGAVVGVAALLCVFLPLRLMAAAGRRAPGAARYGAFFAVIAIGYMAVEIALLQKFGLFLGHPNYALSVVLAALLLFTGIGALFSRALVAAARQLRFVSYALVGILALEHVLAFPFLPRLIGLPFAARVALVFALVAPVGVCLGVFMPTGLDRLKAAAPAFVPWAWGINGIFSVLAPLVAVGLSMSWGITVLLAASLPFYLAAGLLLPSAPAPSGR
jgi:spermidine synthase